MKALRFTFLLVVLSALFTSCVKEDLNEDDQLMNDQSLQVQVSYDTGGVVGEE